jgi:hypothetical protein
MRTVTLDVIGAVAEQALELSPAAWRLAMSRRAVSADDAMVDPTTA